MNLSLHILTYCAKVSFFMCLTVQESLCAFIMHDYQHC